MRKVLVYSIPFGSGPTAKALVIAERLRRQHSVQLATYSHGLDLARRSGSGLSVIDTAGRGIGELKPILDEGLDVLVSVMDLTVARLVKEYSPGTAVVFVDSLLSWRLHEYPDLALGDLDVVDLYIAQYDPGLDLEQLSSRLRPPGDWLHLVLPLVVPVGPASVEEHGSGLLLHYGGVSSPVAAARRYMRFIRSTTSVVLDVVRGSCDVAIASVEDVARVLATSNVQAAGTRYGCFGYGAFQRAIGRTQLLVTTPGLETTYEGIAAGRPVLLLPPLNSTQLHQVMSFHSAGLSCAIPDSAWPDLYQIHGARIHYADKTGRLCDLADQLATSHAYWDVLAGALEDSVSSPLSRQRMVEAQRRLLPPQLEDGLCLIDAFVAR